MHEHITIPLNILTDIKEPMTLRFFLWCLVQATRGKTTPTVRGQTLALLPGQFVFNRRKATMELEDHGFTERKIRTALSRCTASQYVSQKVTQKITVVTVEKFDTYVFGEAASVPINVPKSVPKPTCKTTGQTKGVPLMRSTRNTKNTKNTNNKVKYPLLQKDIEVVFKHYRKTFPTFGRTIRPGHKDWTLIGARLNDGYTVEECISAINGNSVDAWYIAKGLHSVRYIFRDAAILEKFVTNWQQHHQPVISEKTKRGIRASQSWLERKEKADG